MDDKTTIWEAMNRCGSTYLHRQLETVGIDPDMAVTELQRRLTIAERVLELKVEPGVGVTFPGGKLRTSVGMWAVKLRVQQ
jgi:hypothetical protein